MNLPDVALQFVLEAFQVASEAKGPSLVKIEILDSLLSRIAHSPVNSTDSGVNRDFPRNTVLVTEYGAGSSGDSEKEGKAAG